MRRNGDRRSLWPNVWSHRVGLIGRDDEDYADQAARFARPEDV